MAGSKMGSVVSRRPWLVVACWAILAMGVGLLAPDLTRLAAEGQANLLPRNAESRLAAKVIRRAWPEQTHASLAVAALHRPGGLQPADVAFARRLVGSFEDKGRPAEVLRILGPESPTEIAERLTSADESVTLVVAALSSPFVAPVTHDVVAWLQHRAGDSTLARPAGLELRWSGDAVIGRDYMANVQTSLDRAAIATVLLLLVVLLIVYRSIWLTMVPLVSIGASLLVARGILAWLAVLGWEISPLVELFLVAVLFGCGTDFCLFISWRFAENFDANDPVGAMERTRSGSSLALLTSAGTVVIGLLLMGTTRFKLFSSTGPSVALGLIVTVLATLSLTPALLVILARKRPQAFRGLAPNGPTVWDRVGSFAMRRPVLSWAATLGLMLPLAVVGMRTRLLQDLLSELPVATPSAETYRLLASRFDAGRLAPLTVVLQSESDLRTSEGLALVDDVSRFLSRQRRLSEVRSATQPLGTPETLKRARLSSRVGEIHEGLGRMAEGAHRLRGGLYEGLAKLRAALWLEERTGISLTTPPSATPSASGAESKPRESLLAGLRRASSALAGSSKGLSIPWDERGAEPEETVAPAGSAQGGDDRRGALVAELAKAAEGAAQLADGATLAHREVQAILRDPVGRQALDRLMLDERTVKGHPELQESYAVYFSPDGRRARIDMTQADRVFSDAAMDHVDDLRRQLVAFLASANGPKVDVSIAGTNAEGADVRALTRSDQFQSWFVIPIGVFLVLLVALRDPFACANLVLTMLLTYAFALGATHLVFVNGLGAEGLDWKVPYFLFVLLVAVGVDYNVFLMARLHEEAESLGLRRGIARAIGSTGGLITSAAAITACSFASFLSSPLVSLRQLGFALVVGLTVDALLVRPLLVPCGHWLISRIRLGGKENLRREARPLEHVPLHPQPARRALAAVAD